MIMGEHLSTEAFDQLPSLLALFGGWAREPLLEIDTSYKHTGAAEEADHRHEC
jgi:hypothetical protein